jgi:hypothetical protein
MLPVLVTIIGCIHNGSPYAVINNFMSPGSLTIGGVNADYGSATNWSSSTAGLMMECANYTEICVHDSGTRVASLIYYDGVYNNINIGRNKGWRGITNVILNGNTSCSGIFLCMGIECTDPVAALLISGGGTSFFPGKIVLGLMFPEARLHVGAGTAYQGVYLTQYFDWAWSLKCRIIFK